MIPYSELDHILIFVSIFLSVILVFKRSLSTLGAFGALVCACLFVLLDGHFWLGEVLLPPDRNPQIATVGFMIVSTCALLLRLTRKAWRSLDRLMVAGACASVLATFTLFHYVLVQQVLPAWAKDAAWGNSYLLPAPQDQFKSDCKAAGVSCWTSADIAAGALPETLSQQVEGLHRFYVENPPDGEVGHGFGVFNDLGQDGVAVVLYHRDGADTRVIADSKTGRRIHAKVRDMFYLLASVAHGIWLVGALSLLAFHRRRFAKRGSRAD
ncbi:hypothetical protein ACI77O_13170 [Pseudomonas tritici]|uniref:hypothetical protein n=1 Tax=Pseudomonas tritici TaxID=2745518 RepID=UPI00387B8E7C